MSFFTLGTRDRIKKDHYLLSIDKLINWTPIRKMLVGLHANEINSRGGPKAYDNVSMFKALLLGQWHSLSDPSLEEALRLRIDFMVFSGFEMGDEVPDETTLCRFRNKLVERQLYESLFKEINNQLEKQGIKVRKATAALLDATIITSAARPKTTIEETTGEVKKSADPDARWLKKGTTSYFGYRGYAIADAEKGFIHHLLVRPANESESKQVSLLLENVHGKGLLTDKGFSSAANREELCRRGLEDRLSYKASRGHPLKYSQRLFNKIVARRRFPIEQAFGTLKRKFHMARASYFTRVKVEAQLYWKALCFNLNKALRLMQ
jgi:transposase, IS5 family